MITGDSTFTELKTWFLENINNLPNSLDGGHKYYRNVKATANIFIKQIESQIEIHGAKNIKKSAIATSSKNNLYQLWKDLQNKEMWNAPLKKFEDL